MRYDRPTTMIPLMIALGVVLAIGHNLFSGDPLPWKTQARAAVNLEELEASPNAGGGDNGESGENSSTPENTIDRTDGIPESEFPITVSLDRAASLYERGLVRILDARDHEEYAEGHIPGAESAPYDAVGGDPDWLDRAAAEERMLLVYCGGGDCEPSLDLGFALSQAGHRRVLIFEEGYTAWEEAGYPTRTGDAP